jgi:ATP-dependent 26S proteasome regulatory subunit
MDPSADLRLLLASRYPLLVVQVHDEPRFMALLEQAAGMLQLPVWTWSATHGLYRSGQAPRYGTDDPAKAMACVADLGEPGVFVFADFSTFLQNPVVVRQIKELAQAAKPGQTVVLTGSHPDVPPELADLALRWTLPPLDREEVAGVVRHTLDQLRADGVQVAVDEQGIEELVEAVRGLSGKDAERLLRQAAVKDGAVTADDLSYVRQSRARLVGGDGVLELVDPKDVDLSQVGGMDQLKRWLAVRGRAMGPAAGRFGIDPPRGMLLTGVPGCGKSMVAKGLARTWELPLVLLDPARLYGPYVGQSEERLEDALKSVEAMSPTVLWIDEIEKGFAAGGMGDGGVSQRILGTFLRWLQDRAPGVFLVATCNEVEQLPPELLRKGRFDEVFFVDLPDDAERREIFRMHIARRHRDPTTFDLEGLARAADGFSGAEIEAAVVAALYSAFASNAELTTECVIAELVNTVPLSRSRAEDLQRLRAWAGERALAA